MQRNGDLHINHDILGGPGGSMS